MIKTSFVISRFKEGRFDNDPPKILLRVFISD
jgi:hypothetical protein